MPTILRNILAVVVGLVVGSVVNMALVMLGPSVIPPPPGVDMTTAEGLAKGMPLLEERHFVFPFLAHSLGTLVGALVAAYIPMAWLGTLIGRRLNGPREATP